MDRYLVISNHTAEDCKMAIRHFMEYHSGFLNHFEWGCMDGEHAAYAIVEAENHEHAKMAVPALLRDKAKVVKLTSFSKESITDAIQATHL